MKIAIIGATGNVGQRLVDEALNRSHSVTGIARDPSKLPVRNGLTPIAGDGNAPGDLAPKLRQHDAIVSSIGFRASDPRLLIEAIRMSGVKRYMVVGGAGSLWAEPNVLFIETPHFPARAKEEAGKGKDFLDLLRQADDLDWTMLSPAALFAAGERTEKFRLGEETLLTDTDGKSWISYEDYAIALLDELESPRHVRARFTVGY